MVKYIMRRSITLALAISSLSLAQTRLPFEERVKAVISRPEYRHSRFGMEFYSLDAGKMLYQWNSQELFIPGSTTKILTVVHDPRHYRPLLLHGWQDLLAHLLQQPSIAPRRLGHQMM